MGQFALDVRTAVFISSLVLLLTAAGSMLLALRHQRDYLRDWALHFLAAAVAGGLISQRGILPDVLTILAANALYLLSIVLLHRGLCRFTATPFSARVHSALIAVTTLAHAFCTWVWPSTSARVILQSTGMLLLLLPVLRLLIRRPANGPRGSLLMTAGVLGILAVWLGVRVVWTVLSPPDELMAAGTFQALTFVLAAVVNGGLGYSLTNLQADRLLNQLQELAHTDLLTGLLSRRGLERALHGEVERARRSGNGLWLAMFDVDRFKQINDRFGHLAGDELLRQVGEVIRNVIRPYDVAGRFGGDEFCVLAVVSAPEDAARLGERLRRAIGALDVSALASDCVVTTSIGMAPVDCTSGNWQAAMDAADRALYAAKAAGRNCVRLA